MSTLPLAVRMRCEPCPRPVLARRTLPDHDGQVFRHFQCDGNCVEVLARGHACAPVEREVPVAPPVEDNAHHRAVLSLLVKRARALESAPTTRFRREPRERMRIPTTRDAPQTTPRDSTTMFALVPREDVTDRDRERALSRIIRALVVAVAVVAALATTLVVRDASAEARAASAPRPARARDARTASSSDTAAATVDARRALVLADGTSDVAFDHQRAPGFDLDITKRQGGIPAPRIEDVLAAAYRTAGLDGDVGRGFATRARLAGLVPLLSVRTGRDSSWRDSDGDVARGMVLEVRATWRLDRLVFDGRELQVESLDAARRRERRRLAQQVIDLYFRWKRAGVAESAGAVIVDDTDEDPAVGARRARVAGERAEEAAAGLDDLTGGWFSEEVRAIIASGGRTP